MGSNKNTRGTKGSAVMAQFSCSNNAPLMMASPNPIDTDTLDCLMSDAAWGSLDIIEVSTVIYLCAGNYDAIYDCGFEGTVDILRTKFADHVRLDGNCGFNCLLADWDECKEEYTE